MWILGFMKIYSLSSSMGKKFHEILVIVTNSKFCENMFGQSMLMGTDKEKLLTNSLKRMLLLVCCLLICDVSCRICVCL